MISPLLDLLIQNLQMLPGVGPKSAQRMAFYFLNGRQQQAQQLASVLHQVVSQVSQCARCRTFTEQTICSICRDAERNHQLLCVVENTTDQFALEQAGGYSGCYFVLQGRLSPLDGMGPDQLGLDLLLQRIAEDAVTEVILAMNATVEGQATAQFIGDLVLTQQRKMQRDIRITRIAYGVPLGGELDYVDRQTLQQALQTRTLYQESNGVTATVAETD